MPEHSPDFEPLCDLLEQQLNQYQKLLPLMEEMRDCLVKVDVEALDKQVRSQSAQLRQMALLEKKRQAAEQALCEELHIPSPCVLTELIALAKEPQQTVLKQLHQDFAELIPQLQTVQALNKDLIHTNITLNETMLSLLTGPEDPLNNFYSADGREAEEKIISPGIFDQQI